MNQIHNIDSKTILKAFTTNHKEWMEWTSTLFTEEHTQSHKTIRNGCDKLELLIDDELWPLVKYRELLFTS